MICSEQTLLPKQTTYSHCTLQYNTILYITIQCHTVHHNTMSHCTLQYNAILYITIQCHTVHHNTMPYCTSQYNAILYITIQCHTVKYNTMPYCKIQYSTPLMKLQRRQTSSTTNVHAYMNALPFPHHTYHNTQIQHIQTRFSHTQRHSPPCHYSTQHTALGLEQRRTHFINIPLQLGV